MNATFEGALSQVQAAIAAAGYKPDHPAFAAIDAARTSNAELLAAAGARAGRLSLYCARLLALLTVAVRDESGLAIAPAHGIACTVGALADMAGIAADDAAVQEHPQDWQADPATLDAEGAGDMPARLGAAKSAVYAAVAALDGALADAGHPPKSSARGAVAAVQVALLGQLQAIGWRFNRIALHSLELVKLLTHGKRAQAVEVLYGAEAQARCLGMLADECCVSFGTAPHHPERMDWLHACPGDEPLTTQAA